jgi:type IV pilus assembly protein PilB
MLGEMLIAEGLLSPAQLEQALKEQRKRGGRVGSIFKTLGFVTEEDIIKVLGKQMGIPHMVLSNTLFDPEVVQKIPEALARRHRVIPVYKKDGALTLAMVDPLNVFAIDDIKQETGLEVVSVVSTEADVDRAIERYYSGTATMEEAIRDITAQGGVPKENQQVSMEQMAKDTPVIKLVSSIISKAVKEGASDIHIEPESEVLRIRFRIDGVIREVMAPPRHLHAGVASRIKIMADLDIAEKRIPQDGRYQTKVEDKEVDIRLSTLPTLYGEKIVMRLLEKGGSLLRLEELGFSPDTCNRFKKIVKRPYGLILVTGPTGSGKTTTLYAALNGMNAVEQNIVTIEDPVEYQLNRISQVQVNPKVGVTFANGLRSILRQDPDVVMVGEIRDKEAATIAIQAALTGHLVMSTLHTNDAPGAIARLVDMGVEPFLVASSLLCVIGQRLVRAVCPQCKTSYRAPLSSMGGFKSTGVTMEDKNEITLVKGKGCQECRDTGYKGRLGLFEMMMIDDAIRSLIATKPSSSQIRQVASQQGFVGLREEGFRKTLEGKTTLEEILRVTQELDE